MTRYSSRCLTDMSHPAAQAYRVLHVGFTVAPILFGLDKFFNFMVDWTKYLAPWIPNLLHVSPQYFMYGVGAVEIAAGILVGFMPRYFAYVVTLWLWGIIVNLLTYSGYYDIALRDFGLSLGALALGRLAQAHYAEQQMMGETETTSRETRTAPATETASSERRAA